ncbi:MAG: anthranilate synthase component I family protein [Desulfomonilaceae bacterium]
MASLKTLSKELLADMETPVSSYLKLCTGEDVSFLFESSEDVESIGRYSIIAWDPLLSITLSDEGTKIQSHGEVSLSSKDDFFTSVRNLMASMECVDSPKLPFVGSLAGYVGYDAIRLIEKLPKPLPGNLPTAYLCYPSQFVVFDHLYRTMTICAIGENDTDCSDKLRGIESKLARNLTTSVGNEKFSLVRPPQERFVNSVLKAKEHILDGDIFQVVLSDQIMGEINVDPFEVYRWMRVNSPSPYMFFLKLGDLKLAGASPETLVKLINGKVLIRPIAGTRGRSADPIKDKALEKELMESEKERAEHVMLVDLARNDAGRVCRYGSVTVDPYMIVERYSHVMHIVSQVTGDLREGLDAWDAFIAGFPAGTVSGAPKIRAMEIIDDLETEPRGPYGGAVGYWGPGLTMDTCIAIRMIQFYQNKFVLQAGAGIVADSSPVFEYEEIMRKAAHGIASLRAAMGDMS